MIYIAFGVPGVGKSAVLDKVVELTGIKHVVWGDLTVKYMMDNGIVAARDEIRKLNILKQREVQLKVADQIIEISEQSGAINDEGNDKLLIESHAAIKTPMGFWPGMNLNVFEKIKPDVFIVIEASPENILKRRQNDSTRERKDDLTIQQVEDHLQITRDMAATFAVFTGGSVLYVENKEGDVDYAAGKIVEVIEK